MRVHSFSRKDGGFGRGKYRLFAGLKGGGAPVTSFGSRSEEVKSRSERAGPVVVAIEKTEGETEYGCKDQHRHKQSGDRRPLAVSDP